MIINQITQGGGTTPTGTIQITTNGTHDVTNYASADVQVPTTAPQIYLEFDIDANGQVNHSTTSTNIINISSAKSVADNVSFWGAYKNNTNITGSVNLSNLTQLLNYKTWQECFYGCTGITSVNLSSVTNIYGGYVCNNMFAYCTGITSINLDELVTVQGANNTPSPAQSMFYGCTGITGVNIPKLVSISAPFGCNTMFGGCAGMTSASLPLLETVNGAYACQNMFSGCTELQTIDLHSLKGNFGFQDIFSGCSKLVSVDIKSLESLSGLNAIASGFSECVLLPTIKFESLKTLTGQNSMNSCFYRCTALQSLWFYALTPTSFGSYTNQFNSMLSGVTGCTVHFPMAIQSTIGSWTDVTNGFDGTNTTVLFDLVTSLTGADGNTYTRQEKDSTTTATAWKYNDTLYYTSGVSNHTAGVNEPSVGDTIYSDAACTTAVTTISAIA